MIILRTNTLSLSVSHPIACFFSPRQLFVCFPPPLLLRVKIDEFLWLPSFPILPSSAFHCVRWDKIENIHQSSQVRKNTSHFQYATGQHVLPLQCIAMHCKAQCSFIVCSNRGSWGFPSLIGLGLDWDSDTGSTPPAPTNPRSILNFSVATSATSNMMETFGQKNCLKIP